MSYDDFVGAAPASEAAGRGRRGRHGVADLHERHDGLPEGRDAHPPQPRRGCARVGDRVPAEPDERTLMAFPLCHVAGYIVPVTHMRGGLIVLDAGVRARAVDAARRRAPHHGRQPRADDGQLPPAAPEDPTSTTCRASRGIGYGAAAMPVEVLRAAIDRFGPIVYSGFGMTELGGNVLTFPKEAHVRAIQRRRVPPRVVRHADVPRRRQGRRRRHERVPARRRRRDRDPGRAGARRATGATRRARRPRSRAAGSTPATWPGATTRASSTSSTARRT